MQILKTWLTILGAFALLFLTLAYAQLRGTLAGRDAEIARLRGVSRPVGVPTLQSANVEPAPAAAPVPAAFDNTALSTMTADRDRYKDGLDRCVTELNRVAKGSDQVARIELPPLPARPVRQESAPAHTPSGPAPAAEISALYGEAEVTPLGDQMLVTGKLFNTGEVAGRATAVVTLLRDGKPQDTARIPVSVPAKGQASWSHKFTWHSSQGSWTATVSVEP